MLLLIDICRLVRHTKACGETSPSTQGHSVWRRWSLRRSDPQQIAHVHTYRSEGTIPPAVRTLDISICFIKPEALPGIFRTRTRYVTSKASANNRALQDYAAMLHPYNHRNLVFVSTFDKPSVFISQKNIQADTLQRKRTVGDLEYF